jgi:hypothetical protein
MATAADNNKCDTRCLPCEPLFVSPELKCFFTIPPGLPGSEERMPRFESNARIKDAAPPIVLTIPAGFESESVCINQQKPLCEERKFPAKLGQSYVIDERTRNGVSFADPHAAGWRYQPVTL